ncbi:MAG: hypothetical protein EWV63_09035 [Microcystis aeruginosa Ma_OC_H_19870700_S124]|uniref:Uncharacterized protein n=1 Tax=Microcystis aeruginosa Ma_OC_H_19870700_S124 TaxID=2486262 RepID=A0A552AP58_MICAE|nr:MAG: hypothetical protein EWV63_09035 [Microcystis aeruginosa Ma_OC_H_19870700_S124]
MATEIQEKVASGQAENIVVNLTDSSIAPTVLGDQLAKFPIPGLKRVIIIDKTGVSTAINFTGN